MVGSASARRRKSRGDQKAIEAARSLVRADEGSSIPLRARQVRRGGLHKPARKARASSRRRGSRGRRVVRYHNVLTKSFGSANTTRRACDVRGATTSGSGGDCEAAGKSRRSGCVMAKKRCRQAEKTREDQADAVRARSGLTRAENTLGPRPASHPSHMKCRTRSAFAE